MYDTALQEIRLFRSWRGEKTDEKVECKSKAQIEAEAGESERKAKSKKQRHEGNIISNEGVDAILTTIIIIEKQLYRL